MSVRDVQSRSLSSIGGTTTTSLILDAAIDNYCWAAPSEIKFEDVSAARWWIFRAFVRKSIHEQILLINAPSGDDEYGILVNTASSISIRYILGISSVTANTMRCAGLLAGVHDA